MINHVNTVLVSNKNLALAGANDLQGYTKQSEVAQHRGQFIVFDPDQNVYDVTADTRRFKIGMFDGTSYTKFNEKSGETKYVPNVRWSNMIQINDVMSINSLTYADNKNEKVTIDFNGVMAKAPFADGNVSITLRIQYKDMPTRYRQWSESYNYLNDGTESDSDLATAFAKLINKEHKRQRVFATVEGTVLTLEGMPYDDPKIYDQGYENTVRFNAVMYYANPQADGITFHNKYTMPVTVKKEEAERYPADSIIVRTREIEAWDYMGVLHRCCWFDPTPAVLTNLENQYGGLTIEFENEYHAADDIRRHTKETVEIYASNDGAAVAPDEIAGGLKAKIEAALAEHKKYVTEESDQLPVA